MMELKNIYYQLKYHNQEFGSFIENYLGTSADALKEHIAYVAWEHVYNNNNSDLTDQERYDARYSIDIDAIINNVNELEQKVAKLKNKLINLAKKNGFAADFEVNYSKDIGLGLISSISKLMSNDKISVSHLLRYVIA